MRGREERQKTMFYAIDLDRLVPDGHPLKAVKQRVDLALEDMSGDFDKAYSTVGRPSIPPETLLKSLLLQVLHSIPSERRLVEHIRYNMLYRWFLDLPLDGSVFDHATFSKNRERFEEHGLIARFFDEVVSQAIADGLVSNDHFTIDGTLIESYGSLKSLRPIERAEERVRDGSDDDDPSNPTVNFRGERRGNKTHRSVTDPEARLMRKGRGKPALLTHSGHVLMENRCGLCVNIQVDEANGRAEWDALPTMVTQTRERHDLSISTIGADAGYGQSGPDLASWEQDLGVVLHAPIASRPIRKSTDGANARRRARRRMTTKGYELSARIRKRVEEVFGWSKEVGTLRRSRHVGRWKIQQQAHLNGAAYNLVRMVTLAHAFQP